MCSIQVRNADISSAVKGKGIGFISVPSVLPGGRESPNILEATSECIANLVMLTQKRVLSACQKVRSRKASASKSLLLTLKTRSRLLVKKSLCFTSTLGVWVFGIESTSIRETNAYVGRDSAKIGLCNNM